MHEKHERLRIPGCNRVNADRRERGQIHHQKSLSADDVCCTYVEIMYDCELWLVGQVTCLILHVTHSHSPRLLGDVIT